MRLPKAPLIWFLLFSTGPTSLAAQEPAPVVEISGGSIAFIEATESFVGGAARFYILLCSTSFDRKTGSSGESRHSVCWAVEFFKLAISSPLQISILLKAHSRQEGAFELFLAIVAPSARTCVWAGNCTFASAARLA